jgi:hypothetical protein
MFPGCNVLNDRSRKGTLALEPGAKVASARNSILRTPFSQLINQTANAYKMDAVMEWLRKQEPQRLTAPKRFDEVIYSPFAFAPPKGGYEGAVDELVRVFDASENMVLAPLASLLDL